MYSTIRNLGRLTLKDPQYGDFKLNTMPFNHHTHLRLPIGFQHWESEANALASLIPLQRGANQHYLTIDSKFFSEDGLLRSEGIHIDGNYCHDKSFPLKTWRDGNSWGKREDGSEGFITNYATEYEDHEMPEGEYVSETLGGLLCVSSDIGCEAWHGEIGNNVGCGGSFGEQQLMQSTKITLQPHTIYFMTSNTPHQTIMNKKGERRTFIRITLDHRYDNSVFVNGLLRSAA